MNTVSLFDTGGLFCVRFLLFFIGSRMRTRVRGLCSSGRRHRTDRRLAFHGGSRKTAVRFLWFAFLVFQLDSRLTLLHPHEASFEKLFPLFLSNYKKNKKITIGKFPQFRNLLTISGAVNSLNKLPELIPVLHKRPGQRFQTQ